MTGISKNCAVIFQKLAGVTEVKIAAEASLKQTEVNNVEEVTYNNADSADTTAASTQSEVLIG